MSDQGRSLRELAEATRGLSREAFVARHPAPFLVRLEDSEPGSIRKTAGPGSSGRFHTVIVSAERARVVARTSAARVVYPLVKRPGSNAFLHMVTLGRAENNDIVIGHPQVSKFHVSFTRALDRTWAITDASSNGTWLDDVRLELRKPAFLRPGAMIGLSNAVHLVVLPPEAIHDELERLRRTDEAVARVAS